MLHGDLILMIVSVGVVLIAIIVIMLLKEIKNLKLIITELIDINTKIRKKTLDHSQDIPRLIRAVDLNVRDISNIKEQMKQVHHWLGEVLNISNLIPNEDKGISAAWIVDELRQRRKWNEELESRRIDDEEYYKGD